MEEPLVCKSFSCLLCGLLYGLLLMQHNQSVYANLSLWNDSHWPRSWHLNQYDGRLSMNVQAAWKMGYTGKNVVVAVVDDGIEYDHPDLMKNYDPQASFDFIDWDGDPYPQIINGTKDSHGTKCAGIIAAEAGNGMCGVGVAYDSKLGGR